MNPRSRTNWTRDDEERFQALAKQRAEILATNRAPVLDLVLDMRAGAVKSHEELVDWMQVNADRIRDVLNPFDSGTRSAQKATDHLIF